MSKIAPTKIAVFLADLYGGGAERVMLYLARGFVDRGFEVDLVLAKAQGAYLSQIPQGVKVVNLGKRLLQSIPDLARYLRQEQPIALLSALEDANTIALWARRLAGGQTRVVVTVHNTLSREAENATELKRRLAPYLARWFYPWADAIVAVSRGAADDLVRMGLPAERIKAIYNPVIVPEFAAKIREPLEHPWFLPEQPPVILGAGRLEVQKDFATLIRAFALVRSRSVSLGKSARLMILGEGTERSRLEDLVRELGLENDVALPGFAANPFAYMARASAFVLSSLFEGMGIVLVEAMAAGTPVIATDCESGPAEILADGRYGKLVAVGDVEGLASAISSTLENPPDPELLRSRAAEFSLDRAAEQYLKVVKG